MKMKTLRNITLWLLAPIAALVCSHSVTISKTIAVDETSNLQRPVVGVNKVEASVDPVVRWTSARSQTNVLRRALASWVALESMELDDIETLFDGVSGSSCYVTHYSSLFIEHGIE